MEKIISKELLSTVLKIDHILEYRQSVNVIWVTDAKSHCGAIAYNIYELAHKCKEWASKNSYELESSVNMQPKRMHVAGCQIHWRFENEDSPYFVAKTEPEAIFKACQWILKNRSKL